MIDQPISEVERYMTETLVSLNERVQIATEDDLRNAVNAALRREGWTFAQMRKLADEGHHRARALWVAYGDLGCLVDEEIR